MRISRQEKSRTLNDLLGRYSEYEVRTTLHDNIKHRTNQLIRELASIDRKDMIRQLKIINDLHKKIGLISNTLFHMNQGFVMVINRKDITRIAKVVDAFNEYLKFNQIYLLKYKPLDKISLPNNILVYCKRCHVIERGYNNE